MYFAFSEKQLHGSRETLLWHLIPAPRNHILGKGNQIDSLFSVFQKMILTFSGAQGLARLHKTWCILPGNSKWQTTAPSSDTTNLIRSAPMWMWSPRPWWSQWVSNLHPEVNVPQNMSQEQVSVVSKTQLGHTDSMSMCPAFSFFTFAVYGTSIVVSTSRVSTCHNI